MVRGARVHGARVRGARRVGGARLRGAKPTGASFGSGRAHAQLRKFFHSRAAGAERLDAWDPDGVYDTLRETLRAYNRRYGTKATDSAWAVAWYAAWAAVHALALLRWALAPTPFICCALAVSLWFCAADMLHSGTHGALGGGTLGGEAGACMGALFCLPCAWVRQHVLGHHAAVNVHGADPDTAHHAHDSHGWRTCVEQEWRPAYRHWRWLLLPNSTMTQLVPSIAHGARMLLTSRYPGARGGVCWARGERARGALAL